MTAVLTDEEIDAYEQTLSEKASERLGISDTLGTGRSLVQHIEGDFFAMYPDGYNHGITMNVEATGKGNFCIIHAEDGVEVSPNSYYDTFRDALDALEYIEG